MKTFIRSIKERLEGPNTITGYVDTANWMQVSGWVWDSKRPNHPVTVSVFNNGKFHCDLLADHFRADLCLSGIGNGCHGFSINISELCLDGEVHEIKVIEKHSKLLLKDGSRLVQGYSSKTYGQTDIREVLASRFLDGNGLEVGALNRPFPLPIGVKVKYVDRYDKEGLLEHYPQMHENEILPVNIVDDGETLKTVENGSQDFIIACHFLEHCQDPIYTILNFERVLRDGGTLLITVPNRDGTSDRFRDVTSIEHIEDDYRNPDQSKISISHYKDYCMKTEGLPDSQRTDAWAMKLMKDKWSIHFHVFSMHTIAALFLHIESKHKSKLKLVTLLDNGSREIVAVLKKEVSRIN